MNEVYVTGTIDRIIFENPSNFYKNNKMPKIDGIIGGDILFNYNAIIDYKKKILLLSKWTIGSKNGNVKLNVLNKIDFFV